MSIDAIRQAKRQLRRDVVDRILVMDPEVRRRDEAALEQRFSTLPSLDRAATVLLYVSHLPEELGTWGMIRWSLEQGKTVVCPRVDRQARMLRLFRLEDLDRDLVPGPFGIPEPAFGTREIGPGEIDWVLVPGIAFDCRGYRLGRGAGYYDRLLPKLKTEVPRFSMVLDPQWVEHVPTEPHDEAVDGIVGIVRSWLAPERSRGPASSAP